MSVHLSWSLHLPPSPSEARSPILDVTRDGQLLIWKQILSGDRGTDALLLWQPGAKKPSAKLALSKLSHYESSLPPNLADFSFFSLRSTYRGTRILAAEGPRLALLDLGTRVEIGRVLPCQAAGQKFLASVARGASRSNPHSGSQPCHWHYRGRLQYETAPPIVLLDSHRVRQAE